MFEKPIRLILALHPTKRNNQQSNVMSRSLKVKMILPSLDEAKSPYWRLIKYSLFPPLGLATLAGYFRDDDEVVLQDQHVERLDLTDTPDLVCIQVYVTNAYRAFYSWPNILRACSHDETLKQRLTHLMYTGGWKKFEPLWGFLVRTGALNKALPLLEQLLSHTR